MPDLDTDPDDRDIRHYATGPGRHQCTAGPVIEAYADGAIDRHCPHCGAQPLQFCHHDNGVERKMPCPQRLTERS